MPYRGSWPTNPAPSVCEEVNQEYQMHPWSSHLSRGVFLPPVSHPASESTSLLPEPRPWVAGGGGEVKNPTFTNMVSWGDKGQWWQGTVTQIIEADLLLSVRRIYIFLFRKRLNSRPASVLGDVDIGAGFSLSRLQISTRWGAFPPPRLHRVIG